MTAREYTPEEKARLAGGLSREAFELVTNQFERMVRRAFATVPVMTQAAALHGLLCGNQELRDALDTVEYTCKREQRRERRPPLYEPELKGESDEKG